ncbi:2Fe-2S iron-sulfur cluster-binding protein [Hymenobacter bucti]|uniref:2Fe-2S iron-sulfur cluster-binding protein n=1 Tax=Hymenobacter bucti TaxID=1844114 RepID=A0ABW4QUP8_9BACT
MLQEFSPALQPGDTVPNGPLPDGSTLLERRGQPVILAFAPSEWNPAQAHQSAIFVSLSQEFDNGAAFAEVAPQAWHSLDYRGELAEQLGVAGQRALLLLDEAGVLRWKTVIEPGQEIQSGQVLAALEALRPAPAAPNTAAAPSAAAINETEVASGGMSRRTFVTATLAAAALLTLPSVVTAAPAAVSTSPTLTDDRPAMLPVALTINGQSHRLQLDPRTALLDALRENLHLTGTKKGCDHGQCGACTVHLDGHSALSCLTLAVMAQGKAITTIEGLAKGDVLHPLQAAFIKHDAFQCGYCTPGQLMAASALLTDPHTRHGSAVEIREAMSGNLCRCAAYPNIIAAIEEAQRA